MFVDFKKTHIFSHLKKKDQPLFLKKYSVAEANNFIPEGARFGELHTTEYKIEGEKSHVTNFQLYRSDSLPLLRFSCLF